MIKLNFSIKKYEVWFIYKFLEPKSRRLMQNLVVVNILYQFIDYLSVIFLYYLRIFLPKIRVDRFFYIHIRIIHHLYTNVYKSGNSAQDPNRIS